MKHGFQLMFSKLFTLKPGFKSFDSDSVTAPIYTVLHRRHIPMGLLTLNGTQHGVRTLVNKPRPLNARLLKHKVRDSNYKVTQIIRKRTK